MSIASHSVSEACPGGCVDIASSGHCESDRSLWWLPSSQLGVVRWHCSQISSCELMWFSYSSWSLCVSITEYTFNEVLQNNICVWRLEVVGGCIYFCLEGTRHCWMSSWRMWFVAMLKRTKNIFLLRHLCTALLIYILQIILCSSTSLLSLFCTSVPKLWHKVIVCVDTFRFVTSLFMSAVGWRPPTFVWLGSLGEILNHVATSFPLSECFLCSRESSYYISYFYQTRQH